ncbi:alpha/beta hydrolase [Methylocella sp. CPCC 101449]|uniref:alpha/beta fold hydrolase n=1 Tax=Methylocella sp. CPCC 101449 TaxID=2987531 RepID=UPI00288F33CD|nr:alpha/beta hydrolase [Methylocella sp. CPCC 101449]MDT2023105.1 alpha/beta hydrolase [Methylocella sp. CPCC 101449]
MHCTVSYSTSEKPWLILVHGMLTNARHWALNRERLSRAFNLVLVDLPGHGRSGAPANPEDITVERLVERLDETRRGLGIARWYLCGQSFGAGLTLRYALDHPERVIAQAFTNARTVYREADAPQEVEARAERLARLRRDGARALRTEHFHPRFARRFPADLREALSRDADRIDPSSYIRLIGDIGPALSLNGVPGSVPKVPTLLVNGRHERAFQACRATLAKVWPSLEIADIDGGHSVNIENAAGFDAALLDFFACHPS